MADKKETKVMVVPADMPESHLRGMGWAGETADYRVWGATLPADSDHVAIARLFAGLMLADQEKILIPQDINPGAIPLQLLADGSLRFSRGKRFTPWACGEIERIARVMMAEQPAYIREVQLALNYKSAVFTRPPQSFVYQDEHGVARVGPAPAPIPVEVERSDRVLHGLQGYSLVRAMYDLNPYLVRATTEELEARLGHIFANFYVIDEEGRVTLLSNAETTFWLCRMQELIREMERRYGKYPAGWRKGALDFDCLPSSLTSAARGANRFLRTPTGAGEHFLVKYGLREHVEMTLDGRIRIAPASAYEDASLNVAQRDDELTVEISYDPLALGLWETQGRPMDPYYLTKRRMKKSLPTNYYAYCVSRKLSTRLLMDFGGEAALLIRDRPQFVERLTRAAKRKLLHWRREVCDIKYYDPLQVNPGEVELVKSKHFKFAYQAETRVTWVPPARRRSLEPFFLDIGSLSDIAEIVLPEARPTVGGDEAAIQESLAEAADAVRTRVEASLS